MAPTSALLAFMFLTVAASLNVPTCPPGEQANVVSESMFPVVSPFGNNPTINLTLTYFTCPSLQAQARRGALNRQRPLELFIPPLSGVVVTLFNNTCAFVLSNNDATDTYEMELECINSESCRGKEQGPAFGLSVPSPANPNGANWALE
ncbi:hypothetical protein B0H13DRAFT_1885467 [Mycena leptocephala]|nr:hypothetical protein B0H13DRAFT_1885467 [Mycena leptocephala]